VRRWLSDEALVKIEGARLAALGWAGRPTAGVVDPLLPSAPLTLGGLVYTTVFNIGDPRKNYLDLLSAFLIAFRDRPDVTLAIKLVTNPAREHHEVAILRQRYQSLGLRHRCRVVVITDFLDDAHMRNLIEITAYYINTSHAEGACLPLQQALASGRPALAPAHSALGDYMDDQVGFVLESHPEPAPWPHDPERRMETYWHRLVWSSLHGQLLRSALVADRDPERYAFLARSARGRMLRYASQEASGPAFRNALALLPDGDVGTLGWAS
jgi:hypothetical protein